MTSAIRPVKGTAVEFPWKLLVAAAQPYQTLSGPALSVNFHRQPTVMPFQRLPFHHCGVSGRYYHSLLHSLAEFATTPRPVRDSHVRMLHAPMEDFWHAVGFFNCTYLTTYAPFTHEHPAMGAVELAPSSHRSHKDLRFSLYSGEHQPISTMILTGLPSGAVDEKEKDVIAPLPHIEQDEESLRVVNIGDVKRLADGSILQRAIFTRGSQQSRDVVPPWWVDVCVAEFCQTLALANLLAPHVAGEGRNCTWTIAAQQALTQGELLTDAPFDIVSAVPRVFAAYRMPPWRHRIGLPLFSADRQPLCVALRVELRQHGCTLTAGTYFLVEVEGHT
ncbi:hypothetical protein C3747_31g261 [Trypanosoma cruzi]|uniref:Uncharacterized protein n=2 Tax=Trypanosoma cruzi TaxID=5693 RepID=Q4DB32_TRYCC|nr:hypothetical protein, conserved [Trypanosoma cruzi]EAN89740.1 hypothetical protein, conserved [Trypanosoma cruzi]KAF8299532.1 hypothetical protein TcYC6_0065160 [Trypanosoma cruzi]PWV15098.1 hypothetical protein C3747_31g261 [Trypanosoma cruzi]RNC57673.1 hypothetical protein TcCL_ESM04710 [Trypanosoma cruzi]|eukprot:XP_811591.1 hypothetical protein [Trypanosoma cruzi strain CL Brener]